MSTDVARPDAAGETRMRIQWADIVRAAHETSEALNGKDWVNASIKARVLLADLGDTVTALRARVAELEVACRKALRETRTTRDHHDPWPGAGVARAAQTLIDVLAPAPGDDTPTEATR